MHIQYKTKQQGSSSRSSDQSLLSTNASQSVTQAETPKNPVEFKFVLNPEILKELNKEVKWFRDKWESVRESIYSTVNRQRIILEQEDTRLVLGGSAAVQYAAGLSCTFPGTIHTYFFDGVGQNSREIVQGNDDIGNRITEDLRRNGQLKTNDIKTGLDRITGKKIFYQFPKNDAMVPIQDKPALNYYHIGLFKSPSNIHFGIDLDTGHLVCDPTNPRHKTDVISFLREGEIIIYGLDTLIQKARASCFKDKSLKEQGFDFKDFIYILNSTINPLKLGGNSDSEADKKIRKHFSYQTAKELLVLLDPNHVDDLYQTIKKCCLNDSRISEEDFNNIHRFAKEGVERYETQVREKNQKILLLEQSLREKDQKNKTLGNKLQVSTQQSLQVPGLRNKARVAEQESEQAKLRAKNLQSDKDIIIQDLNNRLKAAEDKNKEFETKEKNKQPQMLVKDNAIQSLREQLKKSQEQIAQFEAQEKEKRQEGKNKNQSKPQSANIEHTKDAAETINKLRQEKAALQAMADAYRKEFEQEKEKASHRAKPPQEQEKIISELQGQVEDLTQKLQKTKGSLILMSHEYYKELSKDKWDSASVDSEESRKIKQQKRRKTHLAIRLPRKTQEPATEPLVENQIIDEDADWIDVDDETIETMDSDKKLDAEYAEAGFIEAPPVQQVIVSDKQLVVEHSIAVSDEALDDEDIVISDKQLDTKNDTGEKKEQSMVGFQQLVRFNPINEGKIPASLIETSNTNNNYVPVVAYSEEDDWSLYYAFTFINYAASKKFDSLSEDKQIDARIDKFHTLVVNNAKEKGRIDIYEPYITAGDCFGDHAEGLPKKMGKFFSQLKAIYNPNLRIELAGASCLKMLLKYYHQVQKRESVEDANIFAAINDMIVFLEQSIIAKSLSPIDAEYIENLNSEIWRAQLFYEDIISPRYSSLIINLLKAYKKQNHLTVAKENQENIFKLFALQVAHDIVITSDFLTVVLAKICFANKVQASDMTLTRVLAVNNALSLNLGLSYKKERNFFKDKISPTFFEGPALFAITEQDLQNAEGLVNADTDPDLFIFSTAVDSSAEMVDGLSKESEYYDERVKTSFEEIAKSAFCQKNDFGEGESEASHSKAKKILGYLIRREIIGGQNKQFWENMEKAFSSFYNVLEFSNSNLASSSSSSSSSSNNPSASSRKNKKK